MSEQADAKQQKVHTFSVTPVEQVVLRAVLNDHFKRQVETLLCETSARDLVELDKSIVRFDSMFTYYETCVAHLPNPISGHKPQNKLFYLPSKTMQFVAAAVNDFVVSKSILEEDYAKAAVEALPMLRARINTALEYEYTIEEIRRATK